MVTQPLVDGALDALVDAGLDVELVSTGGPPAPKELRRAASGADAIVCLLSDRVDEALLDAASPGLRVVANVAVGVDNIDLDAARRHGVAVCNTPGVLDAATADLTMAILLAVTRRVVEGMDLIRHGRWSGFSTADSLGRDLTGMRLGIVGFGGIGARVAARASGFDMVVAHHARHPTGAPGYVADLDELLAGSDAVSLHVPLTPETRHLLDARRLSLLPRGAVVVNTARGAVIDEAALIGALESGQVGGAGLDVFDGEPHVNPALLASPHVVCTPHIGSATTSTRRAMCDLAVQGVLAVLGGRAHPHLVVAPGNGPRPGR